MSGICDDKIFLRVYIAYSKKLHHFLYYKTGNATNAEDLVQDTFVRLWNNCDKVGLDKAKNYLFTIANNLFLDNVKHQKVRLKYKKVPQSKMTNQNPEYLLEEQEFKTRLEVAISQLPESQRVVFLMNRIDKMKYREIADVLNISVKAVEKRMHKALVKLRALSSKI